jgi:thiamine-phosphate diphosphorylase
LSAPTAPPAAIVACVVEQVRYAIEAGIDVVQLRERDLEAAELYRLARDLAQLVRGSRTKVVINDRLDVALAAGADGVHLRADSVRAARVRSLAPRGFLVGRSVHAAPEAEVEAEGADYLIAGTVWPTPSKTADHQLLGLHGLSEVVRAAAIPVLAIGGVSLDRLRQVAQTGAAGVAGIGLFMTEGADTKNGCGAMALHALAQAAREAWGGPSIR